MSLSQVGLDAKAQTVSITLKVQESEPMVQLANALDFNHLTSMAISDLKKTEKGCWWTGRAMFLRTHFGVLILQVLLKETDRGMERQVKQTPLYQVFCGYGAVPGWTCPDHTKIETFRSRLSPETYKKIGDYVICVAQKLGFADTSWVDIDSTVQEANIAYPSDATLMQKLAQKARQVIDFIKSKIPTVLADPLSVDMADIKRLAKRYFFLSRATGIEKKREIFEIYYESVKSQILPIISFLEKLDPAMLSSLPWNISRAADLLKSQGRQYLEHVAYFIEHHTMWPGKLLSLHAKAVACICKGKIGKEKEFGRVFQLGRIGGNFMVAFSCTHVRMEDKLSLIFAVQEYRQTFGQDMLKSVGTDKGYYSKSNVKAIATLGINAHGVQRPENNKIQLLEDEVRQLKNRRAGVEPLIGHVKEFGLRRSKMKSDEATLSSGYRSVLGFNLHQLKRHLAGEVKKATA